MRDNGSSGTDNRDCVDLQISREQGPTILQIDAKKKLQAFAQWNLCVNE